MKLNKSKKKLSAIVVASVVTIVGAVLVYNAVLADRRLPGLETLIQEKTSSDEAYEILEIVEDKGEIGFYIEEAEPFGHDEDGYALSFEESLKQITNSADRLAYVAELETRLAGKYKTQNSSGSVEDFPLSYNPYSETYFPESESAWTYAKFDEVKYVDINGEYVEVEQGTGTYTKNGDYVLAYTYYDEETDTYYYNGNLVENIIGFDSTSKETTYRVSFATTVNEAYKHLGVYTRELLPAGTLSSETAFETLKVQNDGLYLIETEESPVWINLNDYTYAQIQELTGPLTTETTLYTARYNYAGASAEEGSTTEYYYVQEYSYAYDGLEYGGTYGGKFDPEKDRYVSCADGQGTHKVSENDFSYTPGNGNYDFVPDNSKPAQKVEMEGFYYTGGFVNNDWFRSKVIQSSADDIEQNIPTIKVRTLTVEQLIEKCSGDVGIFNNVDLLVINGSANMFKKDSLSGSASQTVLANVAEKLRSELEVNKLATIVNSTIVEGDNTSAIGTLLNTYYSGAKNSGIGSVDASIYWFTGDLFNIEFGKVLEDESKVQAGFQDILDYIETENKYIALREGEESLTDNVSQAVVVQYILSYKYARNIAPKDTLTVLEIQPCAKYSLTTKEINKITGYDLKDNQVEIVQMTTAEFVGKIHDLNGVYDFIYFGMNTDLMNTSSSSGQTVYNDSDMGGYVYTHTGDAVIASERLVGMLDTDFVQSDRNNLPYSRDVFMIRTQKDANGKLVLNSHTIDDFYMNTGSNYKEQNKVTVTLGNQGVFRYGGNDITAENVEQLMDYVNAGYPVLLHNDFAVAGTTNDKKTASSINTAKIDNSSCLYDFLKSSIAEDNVFLKTDALSSNGDFKFYMNLPKLHLTFFDEDRNVLSEVTEHYADDSETFVKEVDGKQYLTYILKIEDRASASVLDTNYKVSLFIDINTDGKYSRDHEMLQDVKIEEDGTSKTVAADELVAGKRYVITRRLPDAFSSVVPWKLEVSLAPKKTVATGDETGDGTGTTAGTEIDTVAVTENGTTIDVSDKLSYIRQSQIGYSKLPAQEKQIKVYQIISDPKSGEDTNTWKLAEDYANHSGDFYKDLQSVGEYVFTFNTNTVTEYQNSTSDYYGKLKEYDMLILGFSDTYEGFTNPDAVEAIKKFIESGKSVLFTHDTTSFVNYAGDSADNLERDLITGNGLLQFLDNSTESIGGVRWGYLLNQIVRDKLGMDRYGISHANSVNNKKVEVSAEDGFSTEEAKVILSELLRKGQILNTNDTVKTYLPNTPYTGTVKQLIELAEKDAAYVVGSNKTQIYPETHGYTYGTINTCEKIVEENEKKYGGVIGIGGNVIGTHTTYLNLKDSSGVENLGKTWTESVREFAEDVFGSSSTLDSIFDWIDSKLNKYLGILHNGSFDNMQISRVNKGQITEYPFKIDENVTVEDTHAQYYQLDLEADQDNDGESDIVVWYTISEGYNGSDYKKSPYSASPNDVRNNYYIYSIGNIFYTGAGHESVNRAEKQLFINTLVAAYNAAVNEPAVTILESENINAAELSSKNLPLEYTMAQENGSNGDAYVGDTTITIPYSVYDDNFVYASDVEKELSVEYFIEDSEGTVEINGVKVKPLELQTTQKSGDGTVNVSNTAIQSGQAYTAVWNTSGSEIMKYLAAKESVQIFVRVRADFEYNGEPITLYGYDSLTLKKTNMFELD